MSKVSRLNELIKAYSIPLILGVLVALVMANLCPEFYHQLVHAKYIGGRISLHWLINDVFMVLFFASAAIEIINSFVPGGPLNPINKALTPLMATAGGVLGPIVVFFALNLIIGDPSFEPGWGIVTATDIALAWVIAKIVFGANHPAISFLLLIAVADDAIGVIIVALFYQGGSDPVKPIWLVLVVVGMLVASTMKKFNVRYYRLYVLGPGLISWLGMYNANMHPALALVFIVPFMPNVTAHEVETDINHRGVASTKAVEDSTLHIFEERISNIVAYGMFFFGLTSAGVHLGEVNVLTAIVFLSLLIGKSLGITFATAFASGVLKLPLPEGMRMGEVFVVGVTASIGLTVALFVADAAYHVPGLVSASKMGALISFLGGVLAIGVGKCVGVKRIP